jgi:hypothetical protein
MVFVTAAAALGVTIANALGATIAVGTISFATVAIGFAAQFALGFLMSALAPKPSSQTNNRGYDVNSFGSALDHQIIYGEVKTGGAVVYDNATGNNNKYLHRVIAFAGHEIDSFQEIYLDDELLTLDVNGNVTSPERYNGKLRIKEHLGADNQVADTDLVSEVPEWTTNHRLQGIAYLYVRLKFDADVFPNGVPTFTSVIRGKKIYDPRTLTTTWSNNPALCVRDYLTSSAYGLGESSANIDDDSIIVAANVCDNLNYPTLTGGTKFTTNGAFTTAVTPYSFLNNIMSSMGGTVWYSQGKWRVKPAYYTAPVTNLTDDDLRSGLSISTRHSRRDNFNTVKGTFKGTETNWQVTDYPEYTNAAFVTEDNGQSSVVDLDLPFTSSSVEARRIARIALERNRQQLTVSATFGMKAFGLQVGDIITLTSTRRGWDAKEFEVTTWNFGITGENDLQVQLTLREISESVFDEVDDGVVYIRDNTSLPSAFEVPSVGLSASVRLQVSKEKLTNIAALTVTSGSPERIDHVEVQFKLSSVTDWKTVGTGQIGIFEVIDLEDDLYDFRARAINTFGIKGEWEFLFNIEASGLAIPPSDITGLAYEITNGNAFLEWNPVPDLDLSFYRVRHAIETTGATWANATTAVDKVPRPASSVSLASRSGTYMIRPYDKGGVSSSGYASVVVLPEVLEPFTTTLTQTENPTFSGTKSGCSVNASNYLEITDPSVAPSEATYTFSDYIDTGTSRRIKARVDASVIRINELGNTFDDLPGLFNDLTGLFDDLSGDQDFADTNLEFYISTTEDDPAGTPTWTPYVKFRVGNYYGRAFRFKVILKSSADDTTPNIISLSAIVEYN